MESNIAEVHEAISATIPDRECIVYHDRRLSYAEVTERSRRLANYLAGLGLGLHTERSGLSGWESGQDHVALYMYNCNEYLESMLGCFKSRAVPLNVNYRYVEAELVHLMEDSKSRAIIYHADLAPMVETLRASVPALEVFIQVADDSGNALLPGAIDYEEAIAGASPAKPDLEWLPDDLYAVYTGGTTGMPKGVLWRQSDIFFAALGGSIPGMGEHESMESVLAMAQAGMRVLPSAPFMHAAAHWLAFTAFATGGAVVIQNDNHRFDPHDVWSTVERERVQTMLLIGDAFGRPLLDQLEKEAYDLSSLTVLVTGGAALNVRSKEAFIERLPAVAVFDTVGSSETGPQAINMSTKATGASTGTFMPQPGNCVLSEDLARVLEPGSEEVGWFAKAGRVPLGYLGDAAKTEKTFPVVGGTRYSVPGDRARHLDSGMIEVLGRDSVTINSGGEKIFAEEVEEALKYHDSVYDTVVVGRASERWGQEVVALVALREGTTPDEAALLGECAKHLARYKLPKAFLFLDEIARSPSGKADYRWARAQVEKG